MKNLIKKINIDWILIIVFTICFILIGPASILNKKISHSYPYNILASDAGGELAFLRGLKEVGGYRYLAPHLCAGFEDCIGFHPYVYTHLTAIFSFTSGLDAHNIHILFASVFLLISSILMFLIIRKWNKQIAYLSLPLMLFVFRPQFRIGLMWGWYDVFVASSFILISIYFLMDKNLEKKWMVLSILLAASFITHVYEMFYITAIYFVYFIIKGIINRKIEKSNLIFLFKVGILTAILISYYAIVLKLVWSSPKLFRGADIAQWYDPLFSHFMILKYFIIAGLVISPFIFKKKAKIPLLIGGIMLFFGFNPMHTSAIRTFQIRYLWPVYLAVFFGISIYFILRIIRLNKRIISFSIGFILLITISFVYYEPLANIGLINQNHWDAFVWVKENTDKNANIAVFYGDSYNQEAILWNLFRTEFRIVESSFIKNIEDNKITKFFEGYTGSPGDVGFAYWKSFLKVGKHLDEEVERLEGIKNICLFDYLLFDKISRQPVLAQYNLIIANKLIESKNFGITYQNEEVAILGNMNYNENCIEEGKINE